MKKIILGVIVIFSAVNISFACDFIVDVNQGYFTDGEINGEVVQAGDEICIEAGERGYLKFIDFHGSEDNPIIIKNDGGLVSIDTDHTYGLALSNSSFIDIRGDGDRDYNFGIKVRAPKAGHVVSIGGGSTDIEVSNIEIYGHHYDESYSALGAKTDPKCGSDFVRGKFEMKNIVVHDNYIHDINQGFYFGWTFFTREIECDGETIMGHTMQGVKIYDNIIKRVGQDGLQVSSAISADGTCEIYGNYLEDTSLKNLANQRSSITIGGGSKCDVYDNISINGNGPGVLFLGYAGKIYNNLIVDAGPKGDHIDGMFLDHRSGDDYEDGTIEIYDNTIVNPARNGIRFYNKYTKNSIIKNNLIINPGFDAHENHWAWKENGNYIYLEKGRIDRGEINDGENIEDYLLVEDIENIDDMGDVDNLGLDNIGNSVLDEIKMSDMFGVDAYFELLNDRNDENDDSDDESDDRDGDNFDLDNYDDFIGGGLLDFYFPSKADVLLVNKIVVLINKKYNNKKFALKKAFRASLDDQRLKLRLRWIFAEILKDI